MEKYGTWYLEGDQRRELRKTLEGLGLRKMALRRRLIDDNVLVTYRLERTLEGKQTRVSLRHDSIEEAIPYISALQMLQEKYTLPVPGSLAELTAKF